MPTQKLTPEIIAAAVEGYESQKASIDRKIAELRAMLSGNGIEPAATSEAPTRNRRQMTAAAKKRIGDAQRKRWAASRKAPESPVSNAAPKSKRKLSAAGRKAISDATKKRWALKRAEAAKAKSPVAKKSTQKKSVAKKSAMKKSATRKTVPPAAKPPEATAQ